MDEDTSKLTPKEAAFVAAYLRTSNSAAAAREAFGSSTSGSAASVGWTVKNRPHVAEAINRALDANALGAKEVLSLLSDHARADLSPYLRIGKDVVTFDLEAMREAGLGHLIKEVRIGRDGELTVKIHDAQTALGQLSKLLGLSKERLEITGPDGGPVPMEVRHAFDVEQLGEVARILDECGALTAGARPSADPADD